MRVPRGKEGEFSFPSQFSLHKYTIWPKDGACHANHACAALTVSRSCRQACFFFIENVHRPYKNP